MKGRPVSPAAWLLELAPLRFGVLSLWMLLAFSVVLALTPFTFQEGEPVAGGATLFGALPANWLHSPLLFSGVRVGLLLATVAWFLHWGVPWIGWIQVTLFTLMWSLRMENVTNGAHIFNVTNMLLVVHALWYQFYGAEIVSACARGDRWTARLYPRWVLGLCLFYLGWFHTLAGLTKLAASGWDWGDGTSLQLWVYLFGWRESPFAQLILFDSRLTAALQSGALVIECASILCVLGRVWRTAIGLGLLGFYSGVLITFVGFGFHFNAILVAWYLLPVDRWLGVQFSGSPSLRSGERSGEELLEPLQV